jgi:hypothetical protein
VEIANRVYDTLIEHAGALPDDGTRITMRHDFLGWLTGDAYGREFRFMGALGFGGKLWFQPSSLGLHPPFSVSCYPEDMTPERREMIDRTNAALATIEV